MIRSMTPPLFLLLSVSLCLCGSNTAIHAASPVLSSITPYGGQRGVEAVVTFSGGRLAGYGFLDDVKGFESNLRSLTGKKLKIGYENVGGTRKTRNDIMDSRLRKKVLEICAPDIEIWDAVQDLRPNGLDTVKAQKPAVLVQSKREVAPLLRLPGFIFARSKSDTGI